MKYSVAVVALCTLFGLCQAQVENVCAGMPAASTINIGNPSDCTQFTMCVGEQAFPRTCSPGFHFSASIGQCDLIENAQCTPVVVPPPPGGGGNICSIDINYEMIASQESCSAFTVCACGHAHPQTCATGLVFDARSQRCDVAANAVCLTANPPTCSAVGNVAHPNDCKHFFLCLGAGTTPILRRCEPGLRFNRAINECDRISCVVPPPTQGVVRPIVRMDEIMGSCPEAIPLHHVRRPVIVSALERASVEE